MKVLVTGAGSGLGFKLTQELVGAGHQVIALDVHTTALDNVANAANGHVELLLCDVSDEQAVKKAQERLNVDSLDAIINNAAIGRYEKVMDMATADWQQQLAVNLTGPFLITKYFGPAVIKAQGKIVNIGSRRSVIPDMRYGSYSTTKFGLRGLSLCLAKELKEKQVQVTILELTAMLTDFGNRLLERQQQQAAGSKVLQPELVAKFIVQLLEGKTAWQDEFLLEAGDGGQPEIVPQFKGAV